MSFSDPDVFGVMNVTVDFGGALGIPPHVAAWEGLELADSMCSAGGSNV